MPFAYNIVILRPTQVFSFKCHATCDRNLIAILHNRKKIQEKNKQMKCSSEQLLEDINAVK